jgi:hypothetical protein
MTSLAQLFALSLRRIDRVNNWDLERRKWMAVAKGITRARR